MRKPRILKILLIMLLAIPFLSLSSWQIPKVKANEIYYYIIWTNDTTVSWQDTYVHEGQPNVNYGTSGILKVGYEGGLGYDNTFISFNATMARLFFNNTNIVISKVNYETYIQPNLASGTATIALWRISSDWNENTTTWNNQPTVNAPHIINNTFVTGINSTDNMYNLTMDDSNVVFKSTDVFYGWSFRYWYPSDWHANLYSKENTGNHRIIVEYYFSSTPEIPPEPYVPSPVDLTLLPTLLAMALSIPVFAAGLLASIILNLFWIIPCLIYKASLFVFSFLGILGLGLCVGLTWLSPFFIIIIVFLIALMFGDKIKAVFT